MIIDTNSRVSPGLNQSKVQSPKSKTGTVDQAPETSDLGASTLASLSAQNIASAITPLQDAPAARAAIQAVRQNFLANPARALLAQANPLPENALQLLQ